eukprot:2447153-Amphidinium_carterae.1
MACRDSASSAVVQTMITSILRQCETGGCATEADYELEAVLSDMRSHVPSATEHPCANFVIQCIMERAPPKHAAFIIRGLRERAVWASNHRFGCRVMVRVAQRCADPESEWAHPDTPTALIEEVLHSIYQVLTDKYGQYVVQAILQYSPIRAHRASIATAVLHNPVGLARDPHGCRVVEATLAPDRCDSAARRAIADKLLADDHSCRQLLESRYGCFAVKMLLAQDDLRSDARDRLQRFSGLLDRSWYAKKLKPMLEDGWTSRMA